MITIYIGGMEDLDDNSTGDGAVGVQLVEGEDNVLLTREITQEEYDSLKNNGAKEV